MRFVTSTRALLLACIAATPLLGGADGGCSNDAVSIGGDGTDAGSAGSAGKGGRVPCGPTHCSAGLECCNESCGICVAPGAGCPAIGCVDPCAAQEATGVGSCDAHFGYRWNGSGCESVSGCSCEGEACQGLFPDRASCEWARSNCDGGGGQCAAQDRAVADYFAEHSACTSDADCQNVSIGCSELASDCSGSFYTNRNIDPATVAELRAALTTCVTGDPGTHCPVCTLASPPAACNAGVCGPLDSGGTCDDKEQAFSNYLAANKSCTENIDCRLVNAACTSAAVDCTGAAYANINVDDAVLATLRSDLDTCRGDTGCSVCAAISPPPACVDGSCAPSPSGWSCPPIADSCSGGCNPILARAYDPARQCLSELQTVGCTPATGGTDDIVCVQRETDGALFMGVSGSPFRDAPSGWRDCPEAAVDLVVGAPACN